MSDEKHTIRAALGEPYHSMFWEKVEKTDTCWLWHGTIGLKGYGQIKMGYAFFLAHRLSYEMVRGRIPAGLVIDHLCRVRHCVNPDHLKPVLRGVNTLRGETITAANRAKTVCIHGHSLDDAYQRSGRKGRRCRICTQRYRYPGWVPPDAPQQYCHRGHSLADAYIQKNGARDCRQCRDLRRKKYLDAHRLS